MNAITPPGFDYKGYHSSFVAASKQRANKIHKLEAATTQNVIEMGRLLKEQREAFGGEAAKGTRGSDTWSAWVQMELGWKSGRDWAWRLIRIAETFGDVDQQSTSRLSLEVMKMLATKSTPQELVDEVVELARRGEMPTGKQVRDMKKEVAGNAKPTPTEAKEKAQETGEVVEASDGKYYTPLTDEEREQVKDATNETYDVIDAIEQLSTLGASPQDWLDNAEEHQLIDLTIGSIEDAIAWLDGLLAAYRKHHKVIEHAN